MKNVDLATVLNDAENDLRNGIEQIVFAIKSLSGNMDNLKVKGIYEGIQSDCPEGKD